jgi:hypothetical protein
MNDGMNAQQRYALEKAEKGVDNEQYNAMVSRRNERRNDTEKSQELLRRTAKTGSSGRKQAGVEVLKGNKRPSGVSNVNAEASKMGVPKAYEATGPDDQAFFDIGTGSDGEHGSER